MNIELYVKILTLSFLMQSVHCAAPRPSWCAREIYADWTGQVKKQEGATCGYHAVWNMAQIMESLKTKSPFATNKLKEGPPLAEWQEIIGQKQNINDEHIELLTFVVQELNSQEVTIIPNIREWSPALDETFANIADKLQNRPGSVHGFVLGTAEHISIMTSEAADRIRAALAKHPNLAKSFENALNSSQPLDTNTENEIAQLLFEHNASQQVKTALRLLNKGEKHQGSTGHWVAVVAANNQGIINLHIANSSYDEKNKTFGNKDYVELLYTWLTTPPAILKAIAIIPKSLESARTILDQNNDAPGAQKLLNEIDKIIKETPGLETDAYFKKQIQPKLNELRQMLKLYA